MSFKTQKSFSPAQTASKPHSASGSAESQLELSSPWHRFAWILKDGVVLSCIGLAFFLFLVLFSYHPSDPGFDSSGGGQTVQNYGGATGAWLASMMLYLFGFFGFLVPVGILMAGWVTLKIRSGNELDYLRFVLSLLGLLLMITAGAGLANLYLNPDLDGIQLPYSAGGVWGYELSRWLVSEMDLLGTTLFYLVTFALAMSMLSSCSWLAILEGTGRVACWLADKVVGHFKLREVYLQRIKAFIARVNAHYARWHDQAIARRNQQYRMDNPLVDLSIDPKEAERLLSPKMTFVEVLVSTVKAWALNPWSGRKKATLQPTSQRVLKAAKSSAQPAPTLPSERDAQAAVLATTPAAATPLDNLPDALSQESMGLDQPEQAVQESQTNPVNPAVIGKKAVVNRVLPLDGAGQLPSLELLSPVPVYDEGFSQADLTALSELLEQRLLEFGVSVKVESVQPGPVVTRFEILPAPGVKVSQINNLAKDLARVLSVPSVRVVDVIPGKAVVGIEIPNEQREIVSFRDVLSSSEFQNATSPLTIALGKDIAGKPVVADIGKMPHLLVAGTTGAGKSVGVNSMILSLLYKSTPEEVRLIMVDPKMLELSIYEGIPHLLTPVVTDMSDAANALRWCVFEMDRRYMLMAKLGVRNIAGYNLKVKDAIDRGEPIIDPMYQQAANFGHNVGEIPPTLETLPYIVVVVDEFADMIMVVGKEVEQLIARIAQKARAAGIHLVLATQRPSVNVITGLIKANIPTRISFMVNTKIDSRTILDQGGAEQLLGMGDMLFMPPGSGNPRRVHGAFMSDEEVHKVANFVKSQGAPQYLESITKGIGGADSPGTDYDDAESDALYDEAVEFVTHGRRVSISSVQRRFKIGYNRAARIVEAMEAAGVVSTAGANGNREVLAPKSHEH